MSHREKYRSGRNVAGRNVSQGEMSYNRNIILGIFPLNQFFSENVDLTEKC